MHCSILTQTFTFHPSQKPTSRQASTYFLAMDRMQPSAAFAAFFAAKAPAQSVASGRAFAATEMGVDSPRKLANSRRRVESSGTWRHQGRLGQATKSTAQQQRRKGGMCKLAICKALLSSPII